MIRTSSSIFGFCCRHLSQFCSGDMDFCFGDLTGESLLSNEDILRCPFLRNINSPTNFSFSSSLVFPLPVSHVFSYELELSIFQSTNLCLVNSCLMFQNCLYFCIYCSWDLGPIYTFLVLDSCCRHFMGAFFAAMGW